MKVIEEFYGKLNNGKKTSKK
jgi:hypothetical protein